MTTKPTSHTIALPSDQDATGRTLGDEEIRALGRAIATGTLTSTKGKFVREFEEKFAKILGVKYAYACASGTAAVHCAVAALNPEPGDEIITTAITDMGALTPVLYQGAIPVFADVDPVSLNVTAETVKRAISDRTRAIMVTHLFGNPCEMAAIKKLADERSIPIIEDCAQAFMTQSDGKYVGTIGAVGAFSLQQGKHITTGEGGIVATNDPDLARRLYLFINKAWGYGDPKPDHYFLALNYRLSELQGAVALAQLEKLNFSVSQRRKMADRLTAAIKGLPGIQAPVAAKGAVHTYWKYPLHLDNSVIKGGPVALASALKEANIASAPRYIQKPAFECAVLRDQVTFGRSRWPFTLARKEAVDYARAKFPGTYDGLESVLVLPWNERYTEEHVDHIAAALKRRVQALAKEAANV